MIKYALRSKPTEKLVELAQSGLTEAMDLIIEKFYPMVVRIASSILCSWAELMTLFKRVDRAYQSHILL